MDHTGCPCRCQLPTMWNSIGHQCRWQMDRRHCHHHNCWQCCWPHSSIHWAYWRSSTVRVRQTPTAIANNKPHRSGDGGQFRWQCPRSDKYSIKYPSTTTNNRKYVIWLCENHQETIHTQSHTNTHWWHCNWHFTVSQHNTIWLNICISLHTPHTIHYLFTLFVQNVTLSFVH